MNLVLRYRRRRGVHVVLGTAGPGRTQLRGVTDTAIAAAVELQVVAVRVDDDGPFRLADVTDTMAAAAIETWAEGVRVLSAGEG